MIKLEERVGRLLKKEKLSIAVAESCTGGLLGYLITAVPGSSDYFKGGVIVYQNELKEKFLAVPGAVLRKHGAVSCETARYMAGGIRRKAKANIGVAVTGVAGPKGGTVKKPVGLVYIALSTKEGTESQAFHFSGDRKTIRSRSAKKALSLIRDYLNSR
jgi:PncC family amidohydrolase